MNVILSNIPEAGEKKKIKYMTHLSALDIALLGKFLISAVVIKVWMTD